MSRDRDDRIFRASVWIIGNCTPWLMKFSGCCYSVTVPCTARPCIHALILILIVLYRSGIHGRGLYCARNIAAGELVIEYSGVLIRSSLTDIREKYYDSKVWWHYTGWIGWSVGFGRSDWVVGWLVDGLVGISFTVVFGVLDISLISCVGHWFAGRFGWSDGWSNGWSMDLL